MTNIEAGTRVRTHTGRLGTTRYLELKRDGARYAYVDLDDSPTPDGVPFNVNDLR